MSRSEWERFVVHALFAAALIAYCAGDVLAVSERSLSFFLLWSGVWASGIFVWAVGVGITLLVDRRRRPTFGRKKFSGERGSE